MPFSAEISGLQPLTVYHYQAVASNAAGTVYGGDQTFTTLPFVTLPVVATGTGESVAGVPGAEFSALGNPAINDLDDVAFQGTLACMTEIQAAPATYLEPVRGERSKAG